MKDFNFKKRDVDISEFPIGSTVETPKGMLGTVVAHVGLSEKAIERCVVRYYPGLQNHFRANEQAVILPKHLKKHRANQR